MLRNRLVVLVSAIVFVDTMFYGAITPLLPELSERFDLGKQAAGLLAGAYAIGTLVGALPGGLLAAHAGVKPTVLLGLTLMAVAGVAFAFGESIVVLDLARFVQGVGGACTWAAGMAWLAATVPRERRGEVLGTALGAAIFGVQVGPLLGAVATEIGQEPVFSSTVAFAVALGAWAWMTPALTARVETVTTPRHALGNGAVRAGLLLVALPGLAFGLVEVLAPLRLDRLGASGVAIGAAFFAAAGVEALVAAATGRLSDRRGAALVARVGLVAGALALVALQLPSSAAGLVVVLIAAGALLGMLWTPAMALMSSGAEHVGLDQGLAFGLSNLSWSIGMALGATVGGALAEATADAVPYLLVATAYAIAAVAVARGRGVGEPTARGATVS